MKCRNRLLNCIQGEFCPGDYVILKIGWILCANYVRGDYVRGGLRPTIKWPTNKTKWLPNETTWNTKERLNKIASKTKCQSKMAGKTNQYHENWAKTKLVGNQIIYIKIEQNKWLWNRISNKRIELQKEICIQTKWSRIKMILKTKWP